MRKRKRRELRPWTSQEDTWLEEQAGSIPLKDIAAHLGRSESAVRFHASSLRSRGRSVRPLKVERSRLVECPECHAMRTEVLPEGFCRVCKERRSLEARTADMKAAYDAMPRELRDRTNGTFRIDHKKVIPFPPQPDFDAMPPRERVRAMDSWLSECESVEVARLRLENTAVRQRTCKWKRKSKAFRNKSNEAKHQVASKKEEK